MSRMIGYVAPSAVRVADGIGESTVDEFAALARLHSDGWGTAWVADRGRAGAAVCIAGGVEPVAGTADLLRRVPETASTRMLYLRFASRGAVPAPENTQPFLRDGLAFQHNGLIAPRDELVGLLSPRGREALRGTTDSEAYFQVVLEEVRGGAGCVDLVARGVAAVRERFAGACLNAMLCTPAGLLVVHSPGTARVPLHTFSERGVGVDALPPGHDEDYNVLRMTTLLDGTRVVATTGIDQRGWEALPVDAVTLVGVEGVVSVGL